MYVFLHASLPFWMTLALMVLSAALFAVALSFVYLRFIVYRSTIAVVLEPNSLRVVNLERPIKSVTIKQEFSHHSGRYVTDCDELGVAIQRGVESCLDVPNLWANSNLLMKVSAFDPFILIVCREELSVPDMYSVIRSMSDLSERYGVLDACTTPIAKLQEHIKQIRRY